MGPLVLMALAGIVWERGRRRAQRAPYWLFGQRSLRFLLRCFLVSLSSLLSWSPPPAFVQVCNMKLTLFLALSLVLLLFPSRLPLRPLSTLKDDGGSGAGYMHECAHTHTLWEGGGREWDGYTWFMISVARWRCRLDFKCHRTQWTQKRCHCDHGWRCGISAAPFAATVGGVGRGRARGEAGHTHVCVRLESIDKRGQKQQPARQPGSCTVRASCG